MHFTMAPTALLALAICYYNLFCACAAPEPEPFKSHSTSSLQQQGQNLDSVIQSIEERLRSLDSVYSLRFTAPRWELIVETQTRKLEALESKLSRIETLVDLRIDKIFETLNSKNFKEEFARDQLGKKIDSIYERLNHRMSYMESRIENNIAKMQGALDDTLTKMSQQLEHIDKNVNMIDTDVVEVATAVDDIKVALVGINNSLVSKQGPDKLIGEEMVGKELNNIVNKITDRHFELLVKIEDNGEMLRRSIAVTNSTKKELQEGIQALKLYKESACQTMPDADTFDILMGKIDTLSRKTDGNYHKLDYTINRLIEKQDMFQDSCLRIQEEEPQIEDKISNILEKILDSIDGRTNSTDKNYEILMEGLKSHHKHVLINVGQVTNNVVKLSQQITEEFKSFYNEIVLNNPSSEKIDSIISSLQDLQDSFLDINATLHHNHETPFILNQNNQIANATKTILTLIQTLNENINVIIEKLNDYYRGYSDSADVEEGMKTAANASQRILNIFNMTEDDLARVKNKGVQVLQNETDKGDEDWAKWSDNAGE